MLDLFLESSEFDGDALDIFRVRGREALGEPFHFSIDVAVAVARPAPSSALLGATATLVFAEKDRPPRRFHGMIAQVDERLEKAMKRAYRKCLPTC